MVQVVRWEDGETKRPVWVEEEKKEEAVEDMGWLERGEREEVVWWENLKEKQPGPGNLEKKEEVVGWRMDGDQLVWWRTRREDRKQVQRRGEFQEAATTVSPQGGRFQPRGRKDATQREQERRQRRAEMTECRRWRRRPPPSWRPWWAAVGQLRSTLVLWCTPAVWVWLVEGEEEEEEQLVFLPVRGSDGRSAAVSLYREPCS